MINVVNEGEYTSLMQLHYYQLAEDFLGQRFTKTLTLEKKTFFDMIINYKSRNCSDKSMKTMEEERFHHPLCILVFLQSFQ